MKTELSPYHHPWIWLMRESAKVAAFTLAAWAVIIVLPVNVLQFMFFATLLAIALVIAARTAVAIFVAALCEWFEAMGAGLGTLVVALRRRRLTR